MIRRAASLAALSWLLAGCAANVKDDAPEAGRAFLVGTWEAPGFAGAQKVFLASGAYCTYANPSAEQAESVGSWVYAGHNTVDVDVTWTRDLKGFPSLGANEFVFCRVAHGTLWFGSGIICIHCGGELGDELRRARPQRTTCAAPPQPEAGARQPPAASPGRSTR